MGSKHVRWQNWQKNCFSSDQLPLSNWWGVVSKKSETIHLVVAKSEVTLSFQSVETARCGWNVTVLKQIQWLIYRLSIENLAI